MVLLYYIPRHPFILLITIKRQIYRTGPKAYEFQNHGIQQ